MDGEKYRHHHILFSKNLWQSQPLTKELRSSQWLKPPLYDEAHAALHNVVSVVPVPDWNMANYILRHFEPVEGDYLRTVDNLLTSIEGTIMSPRSDVVQRGLGKLMIMAIDLQRPYVIEGMAHDRAYTA